MAGLSFTKDYRDMLVLLKRARERAGLTQTQVARAFGRSQPFLSKVEGGEIRIDPVMLLRFAGLYRVQVTDLLPEPAYGLSVRTGEG